MPEDLASPINHVTREDLSKALEREDWRQAWALLQYFSRSNNLSSELSVQNAAARKKIEQLSRLIFQEMLTQITDEEKRLIGECLHAISNGPFLSDLEFRILVRLERAEMVAIAECWPDFDDKDDAVPRLVSQSLLCLVVYPRHKVDELPKYVSASEARLKEFTHKWFTLRKNLGDE